jgi:ankyrin repeat protein
LIKRKADVNVTTVMGLSPLLLAAQCKHSQILQQLLKAGAHLDFQGGELKNSALHISCLQGDVKSVKVVLEYLANSDTEAKRALYLKNKKDQTAFDIAKIQANGKEEGPYVEI